MVTSSVSRRSTRSRPSDDVLLDAARGVFLERGFRGTSMTAVAERADSTKPTLYAHFGDKAALYRRLLEREAGSCRRWLFDAYEANAGLDLADQVAADTMALFDYAAAEPEGFRLLLGDDPTRPENAVQDQLLADVDKQIGERIHAFIAGLGLQPWFDVDQLAAILVAVPVSSARHALDSGADMTRAAGLAARFSAAALTGLAPADVPPGR